MASWSYKAITRLIIFPREREKKGKKIYKKVDDNILKHEKKVKHQMSF